jgi:hypothetical protein
MACAKCGEKHKTKTCKKQEEEHRCTLCGEAHAAWSLNCKKKQEAIQNMKNKEAEIKRKSPNSQPANVKQIKDLNKSVKSVIFTAQAKTQETVKQTIDLAQGDSDTKIQELRDEMNQKFENLKEFQKKQGQELKNELKAMLQSFLNKEPQAQNAKNTPTNTRNLEKAIKVVGDKVDKLEVEICHQNDTMKLHILDASAKLKNRIDLGRDQQSRIQDETNVIISSTPQTVEEIKTEVIGTQATVREINKDITDEKIKVTRLRDQSEKRRTQAERGRQATKETPSMQMPSKPIQSQSQKLQNIINTQNQTAKPLHQANRRRSGEKPTNGGS